MASRTTRAIRFKVLARLGAGGMGDVHLATMTRGPEQRLVALKRLHPHLLVQPGMVQTFEREARISALLSHPHIAAVHAFGSDAAGPYLALEYVEGRSASALLSVPAHVGPTIQRTAALRILCDVASALAHAHAFADEETGVHGVVHRDISLDNVLVSYTGVAKLADFGIATLVGGTRVTQTGVLKGKFGFIAPELFEGQPADPRSDVFALAAAAFQLLTGMKPFPGNTEAEILRAVLSTEPPALSALRPDLPTDVCTWVERGLQKVPAERLPARALRDAIEEALSEFPEQGRDAVAELMDQSFPVENDARRASTSRLLIRHTRTVESAKARRQFFLIGAGALGAIAAAIVLFVSLPREPHPEPLREPVVMMTDGVPTQPGVDAQRDIPIEDTSAAPPMGAQVAQAAQTAAAVEVASGPSPRPEGSPQISAAATASQQGGEAARDSGARVVSAEGRARRAPVRAAKAERRTATAPVRTGTLRLRIQPWARVHVDGDFKGVTPMGPIELPAGTHTLLLTNDELRVRRTMKVTIRANREKLVKLALE